VALHRKARRQLEGRPLPRLQYLHLVAQQLPDQSAEKQRCSVCGQRGVEQPVRAGRPSDRLQGGAKDVGQVGGQAYRPQQNPCLLHGHVSQPLHVSFSLFSALTTTSFLSFLFRCTIRPRQYQYPTLVLISSWLLPSRGNEQLPFLLGSNF
jgi:hypothetical protein